MGVKHCAWGTCTSDSRDKEKEHMRNVKFYSFPKPDLQNDFCEKTIRCRNWIKARGRPHSQLNLQKIEQDYKKYRYYYVICSKHFPDGKPTDQYPDPVPADPSSKIAKTPKRKAPCHGKDDSSTKKQKTSSGEIEIAKILVSLSKSKPSTPSNEVGMQNKATVSCPNCSHKFVPKKEDLKKLDKQAFIDEILKSDENCFRYTGVPTVAALHAIYNWIDPAAQSVKLWDGKNKLVPGRQKGRIRKSLT